MRRALASLAAAIALVAAPRAEAQRKDPAAQPAAGAKASTSVPLPPPPAGTKLVAKPPAPPPPVAEPPAAAVRGPGWLAFGAGAWAGLDAGSGFALHLDYGFTKTPPSWDTLTLEWRLGVMFARPTSSTDLSRTVISGLTVMQIPSGSEKTSLYLVEVVPSARVRWAIGAKFALFADGGAGLAQTVERKERDEQFVGRTVTTKNVTGLVLRLGGGMSVDVSQSVRVLLVPIGVSFQVGPDWSGFTPELAVAFRL